MIPFEFKKEIICEFLCAGFCVCICDYVCLEQFYKDIQEIIDNVYFKK